MAKIESLNDIESIIVHWSESNLINDELVSDENCDIEKPIDADVFNDIVKRAIARVKSGYDKTSLTVKLKTGGLWADRHKFYICNDDTDLLSLLNKGD